MATFYLLAAAYLLLTVTAGLVRVAMGPSAGDRMLSAQLFGTSGVAILLLLGQAADAPAYWNVALVLALLAVVAVAAFVQRVWPRVHQED